MTTPDTNKGSMLGNRGPLIILSTLTGVIATVLFLELQGLLKHSSEKEQYALSQYSAIFINQLEDGRYRLSHKSSHQHARCIENFLFIQSDTNPDMKGLLVDYKNRGVKCAPQTISTDATSTEAESQND